MGANSKQGWCLFLFLVGFTFTIGGLAYLGAIFTLLGLAALAASVVGFYQIRMPDGAAKYGASGRGH